MATCTGLTFHLLEEEKTQSSQAAKAAEKFQGG
jgi:hypothetical protein